MPNKSKMESREYVRYMEKKTLWCGYWIGLGILSLVGIGRGQHIFLLYLAAGSAIGELPPYVMAGVVRLSGADPDDAEYQPRTRGNSETVAAHTFRRHMVEQIGPISGALSLLGAALQKPYREYWEAQKAKPHHHTGEGTPTEESWLSWPVERVVVIMVCFFVCSIVSSMAQSCVKRRQQGKCIQKKKAG